jgi:outer membrane lipoprotein-sorting protein
MPYLKRAFIILAVIALLPACAPRVAVKPIPSDTPPDKVVEMVRAKEAGLNALRAYVKVTVQEHGGGPKSFEGVLYAQRPDKVRLTGLGFMGFAVFDVVLRGEKFYFYQPDTGYLYTGKRAELRQFLQSLGVTADPEVLYRSIFTYEPGDKYRYLMDATKDGYSVFVVTGGEGDAVLRPVMKAEYDAGLNPLEKIFYDKDARPYLYVVREGTITQDGFELPANLKATDTKEGYSVDVEFEKYIINPTDNKDDFTIQGGELREIKTLDEKGSE